MKFHSTVNNALETLKQSLEKLKEKINLSITDKSNIFLIMIDESLKKFDEYINHKTTEERLIKFYEFLFSVSKNFKKFIADFSKENEDIFQITSIALILSKTINGINSQYEIEKYVNNTASERLADFIKKFELITDVKNDNTQLNSEDNIEFTDDIINSCNYVEPFSDALFSIYPENKALANNFIELRTKLLLYDYNNENEMILNPSLFKNSNMDQRMLTLQHMIYKSLYSSNLKLSNLAENICKNHFDSLSKEIQTEYIDHLSTKLNNITTEKKDHKLVKPRLKNRTAPYEKKNTLFDSSTTLTKKDEMNVEQEQVHEPNKIINLWKN